MQEPYTYETLFEELNAQPDRLTTMHETVQAGTFASKGTGKLAICDYTTNQPAHRAGYVHAVRWACYLHPVLEVQLRDAIHLRLTEDGRSIPTANWWSVRMNPFSIGYVFREVPDASTSYSRLPCAVLGDEPLRRLLSAKTGLYLR